MTSKVVCCMCGAVLSHPSAFVKHHRAEVKLQHVNICYTFAFQMNTFFCTAFQGKNKWHSWTKFIYKIVFVFLGETTCWNKASRHLELLLPNLPSQCLRPPDAMLSLSGVIFCICVLYFVLVLVFCNTFDKQGPTTWTCYHCSVIFWISLLSIFWQFFSSGNLSLSWCSHLAPKDLAGTLQTFWKSS